jgi:deferrochelatase/peroxidase EfeB
MSSVIKDGTPVQGQNLVVNGYGTSAMRQYLVRLLHNPDGNSGRSDERDAKAIADWINDKVLTPNGFFKVLDWLLNENSARLATKDLLRCDGSQTRYQVDIGFCYAGLEKLGLQAEMLNTFRQRAPAFTAGAALRAAAKLGDTGYSDVRNWDEPYQFNGADLVMLVHACKANGQDDGAFTQFEAEVAQQLSESSASKSPAQNSPDLVPHPRHWREDSDFVIMPFTLHFGMVDGLSSPKFACVKPSHDGWEGNSDPAQANSIIDGVFCHHLGELLLGYPRNDGSNDWRLPTPRDRFSCLGRPSQYPAHERLASFFVDGAFCAIRKMEQDVDHFNDKIQRIAATIEGESNSDLYVTEWLKAKILGRWANGDVTSPHDIEPTHIFSLLPGPISGLDLPPSTFAPMTRPFVTGNDFDFRSVVTSTSPNGQASNPDPNGLGCPYGAHIRRMNPRNDPVVPFIRRPLLRRGKPYTYSDPNDKPPSYGLLGMFFCANLEEQFEHVLGSWSNNAPMGLAGNPSSKDPLIGNHQPADAPFEIPVRQGAGLVGQPIKIQFDMPFVKTKGTLYTFFPSVSALRKLPGFCDKLDGQ